MSHRIQNFTALAVSPLRQDALAIAEAGYAAIDVASALNRTLRIEGEVLHMGDKTYSLFNRRIFFVGVGKCALAAAAGIESLLGERLTAGIALDVSSEGWASPKKIEAYIGTHPLPSETNVAVTKHIIEFLSGLSKDDFVIMLISGGGSALLALYEEPMTYTDESRLWNELTAHGTSIQDINTVRKHISRARGGALAAAAYPAEVLSLIVSDVPGNDIEYISSGPTILDTSTVDDARQILSRISTASSTRVRLTESPKEPKYFERVTNALFLTNQDALKAMQTEAESLGYAVQIVTDHMTGEAQDLGRSIVEKLHDAASMTAHLYAGESTVTLAPNHGQGGRNQELSIAAMQSVRDGELVLPFASDGRDNTDHAGAIGDVVTRAHAIALNVSDKTSLDKNSAYDFFKATGDALVTGYTGTNVSDLIIALKK